MKGNSKQIIDWLLDQDKEKQFEIKEIKEKRTLTKNAYYWVLINKLANALRTSKEELHIQLLKRYSQVTSICIPGDANIEGFIRYFELDGIFKKNGNEYKIYKVYLPSSEMDNYEFSILLDGIIFECKEMGIETLTPDELRKLERM